MNKEAIIKLNELVAEADDKYGKMTEVQSVAITRASYKLGMLEAYNDDNDDHQIDTMDLQVWLNGDYDQSAREAGYKRYCDYALSGATPKYKASKEKDFGSDFRESKWMELIANRKAEADAKEAAKEERRKKREAKKQKK